MNTVNLMFFHIFPLHLKKKIDFYVCSVLSDMKFFVYNSSLLKNSMKKYMILNWSNTVLKKNLGNSEVTDYK